MPIGRFARRFIPIAAVVWLERSYLALAAKAGGATPRLDLATP